MLLPQLETLALSVESSMDDHFGPLFIRLRDGNSLRHLSLDLAEYDLHWCLFKEMTGLNLDSLHIRSSTVLEWSERKQASRWKYKQVGWDRLASEERNTFRVRRVVCYGDAPDTSRLFVSEEDAAMFEWRIDEDKPPFRSLDGC